MVEQAEAGGPLEPDEPGVVEPDETVVVEIDETVEDAALAGRARPAAN